MCGVNFKEREEQMSRNLPGLFKRESYRSVLYVGANKRRQHFLDWFEKAGYLRIVVLEAFRENYEFLRAKFDRRTPPYGVAYGDVRNVDSVLKEAFDVAFFWHGPEHLSREEIMPVLESLEGMSRIVVLGCPHGAYKQGPEYGNPYEEHLTAIYPEFLEGLGYGTDVVGEANERGSNIMAWKFVGGKAP